MVPLVGSGAIGCMAMSLSDAWWCPWTTLDGPVDVTLCQGWFMRNIVPVGGCSDVHPIVTLLSINTPWWRCVFDNLQRKNVQHLACVDRKIKIKIVITFFVVALCPCPPGKSDFWFGGPKWSFLGTGCPSCDRKPSCDHLPHPGVKNQNFAVYAIAIFTPSLARSGAQNTHWGPK